MTSVRIDIYPNEDTGTHLLDVTAMPEGLVSPDDLPGRSADIVLDDAQPRPGAQSLHFVQAVASPCGLDHVGQPDHVHYAYLYHPQDETEILDFDRRITEAYSAFYAGRGLFYAGTFHVTGPDGPSIGEIVSMDTPDRKEAERRGEYDLSEEIIAIEDECRTLQDRTRPRYLLWLTPRQTSSVVP
ncbi:MAG TPA: hypothetical protein VF221_03445 [Chloroflexota bacterium]